LTLKRKNGRSHADHLAAVVAMILKVILEIEV
jgi:hypothetical protein